jgi:hypothetical protein
LRESYVSMNEVCIWGVVWAADIHGMRRK